MPFHGFSFSKGNEGGKFDRNNFYGFDGLGHDTCTECKSIIPFRALYVECQDNPYLRFFYEKTGFRFYRSNPLNGLLIYIKGV